MSTIVAQICIRRDTAANFTSANPTLALGEIAYETDTRNIKVGDGATAWTALGYINPYRGGTAAAPTSNTVLGNGAGAAMQSGAISNTAIGNSALAGTTTGDNNTAVGNSALFTNTTASNNTAVGQGALYTNTGASNTAVGTSALLLNSSGASNVAVGSGALVTNSTGSNSTAVGFNALNLNTASDITAVGAGALDANTTGALHVAIGRNACGAITTADACTAIGWEALSSSQTGGSNTAIGRSALANATGSSNTAVGSTALVFNTTGGNNVALGVLAGAYLADGSSQNQASTDSVFIGSGARAGAAAGANCISIGHNAIGNGSNTTTIGNSSTTGTFIPAGDLILSGSTQQIVVGTSTIPASEIVFLGSRQFETNAKIQATGSGSGSNAAITLDANTEGNWIIQTGNAVAAGLRFYDFNVGGGSERIRFDASGNIDLKAGNVIVTSGKGIDFSATSHAGGMTSELLSDYEEGTWTPTFSPASGAFTTLTMDVQSATYTKIGRQVTVRGYIRTDNVTVGTASGQLSISGLPFTVAGSGFSAGSVSYAVNWAAAPESVYANAASTSLFMTNLVSLGGGTTFTQVTALTTGATADRNELVFSCTYFV